MFNTFINTRVMTTVRRRIMVVSAKGGVGKSTTTVNLAAALVANGYSAGIFDADVHGPNIPALLGIRHKGSVEDSVQNMVTIEARAASPAMRPVRPFERYGIKLTSLALLVGEHQAIQPQTDTIGAIMTFMLRQVDWGGIDVLLLDMPPGTGEPLDSLLETGVIDGAVIVTTRERLAHLDNGRLLDVLKRSDIPIIGIIENMTHIVCPRCGELIELYPLPAEAETDTYGGLPILAQVPFDPGLIRHGRGGSPLPLAEPEAPIAQIFRSAAGRIM